MNLEAFDRAIRRVQNFPRPGVSFYDITSILINPEAFSFALRCMSSWVDEFNADTILAVEARGFLFAAPLAEKKALPLVLARKKGKLPSETWCQDYSLEYGMDTICVHKNDIRPGSRVLLLDDLIATGGTFKAAAKIIEQRAASTVVGFAALIGLPFLGYEKLLSDAPIRTIINYDGEG